METKDPGTKASESFYSGYNCAQSVLLAATGEEAASLKCAVAAGFGGGIGRSGGPCGAFTGAVMALGVLLGEQLDGTQLANTVRSLEQEFVDEFGSIQCRELTGCDLTTVEGRTKFEETQRKLACETYVRFAAKWVEIEYRRLT